MQKRRRGSFREPGEKKCNEEIVFHQNIQQDDQRSNLTLEQQVMLHTRRKSFTALSGRRSNDEVKSATPPQNNPYSRRHSLTAPLPDNFGQKIPQENPNLGDFFPIQQLPNPFPTRNSFNFSDSISKRSNSISSSRRSNSISRRLSSRNVMQQTAQTMINLQKAMAVSGDQTPHSLADVVSGVNAMTKLGPVIENWAGNSRSSQNECKSEEMPCSGSTAAETEDQDSLVTTKITIQTHEQLEEHINERKGELEKNHLDEVEHLDKILTEEMNNFKKMCTSELTALSPDNENDRQQIERRLMVHKMRMQRLKEHQSNAKKEVDKRHSKETKKVTAIIAERLSSYDDGAHGEQSAKALAKLLGFLNGPTFNKMVEQHPILYEPLDFENKLQKAKKQLSVLSAFSHAPPTPTNHHQQIEADDHKNGIKTCSSEGKRSQQIEADYHENGIQTRSNEEINGVGLGRNIQNECNLENEIGTHESFIAESQEGSDSDQKHVIQYQQSMVDICWFSAPNVETNDEGMCLAKTISLANCKFNIVPPPDRS